MGKKKSIIFTLLVRLCTSIIFFIALLAFGNILYSHGKLDDLSIDNGIVLMVLNFVILLCATITMCGIYRYSDPLNMVNKINNRLIFCLQIVALVFHGYMLMNLNKYGNMQQQYNGIIIVLWVIVLVLHGMSFNNYWHTSNEELKGYISAYCLETDEKLLEIVSGIRIQTYKFAAYLVLVLLFYDMILVNIATEVTFIIINSLVIAKLFLDCLKCYSKSIASINKGRTIISSSIIFSSIGSVLIFLLYKGYIVVGILENRTAEEYGSLLLFFYIPLFMELSKIYFLEERMRGNWNI